jgi:hypothetical protein
MIGETRVGEVIEACTRDFNVQCYELYRLPPLGSLVKTRGEVQQGSRIDILGVVYNATTSSLDQGRRPIARGKDEINEDEIYRSSPQLLKLLRSEFSVLVVGYLQGDIVFQCLPPQPARIHSFVHLCTLEEMKQFGRSFDFLNILLTARVDIPATELISASLRQMGRVYGVERHAFLVSAGKELAALLCDDYVQLKAVLKGLKNDAAG